MNSLEHQETVLNIRYDLPSNVLDKLIHVYEKQDGWIGYGEDGRGQLGIPYWFSTSDNEKTVMASVEPGGLQISALMEDKDWENWIAEFKEIATEILGFKVLEIG